MTRPNRHTDTHLDDSHLELPPAHNSNLRKENSSTAQNTLAFSKTESRDAGLALRVWASLLDTSLVLAVSPLFVSLSDHISANVVTYFVTESLTGEGVTEDLVLACITALGIAVLVSILGWFLASSLFLALMESFTGASPGKHLLGLTVTTKLQRFPGIARSLLRQNAKLLSSLILGLGFLMPILTARKQALHDKIANCYVVKSAMDRTGRILFSTLLSAILLFAIFPTINQSYQQMRSQVERIWLAYNTVGPAVNLAWQMVQEGIEGLEQTMDQTPDQNQEQTY